MCVCKFGACNRISQSSLQYPSLFFCFVFFVYGGGVAAAAAHVWQSVGVGLCRLSGRLVEAAPDQRSSGAAGAAEGAGCEVGASPCFLGGVVRLARDSRLAYAKCYSTCVMCNILMLTNM